MTRGKIFAATTLAVALCATGALAQSKAPPTPSQTPQGGYTMDWYTIMAVKSFDANILKSIDTSSWQRASKAAAFINAGKCGEAAAIAAQAQDEKLMAGVKRSCRAI